MSGSVTCINCGGLLSAHEWHMCPGSLGGGITFAIEPALAPETAESFGQAVGAGWQAEIERLNPMTPKPKPPTVLQEADALIHGDRQAAYGHPRTNLERVGRLWSEVLGSTVTAEQVCLCMALLKVSRHVNKAKRDNLVDAAGYIALIERLAE